MIFLKKAKSTKNRKTRKVSEGKKAVSVKKDACKTSSCWRTSSIVLGILFIATLALALTGAFYSGDMLSQNQAEARANEFVNKLSTQDMPLAVESVEQESGAFRVVVGVLGQTESWFMSADGEYLFPSAFTLQDIEVLVGQQQMDEQQQPPQEAQDPGQEVVIEGDENVEELVSCLADNDFMIYGADWCGFTVQVVDLFGGADISDIYVECTDEEELCADEQIRGYPTIRLAGEDVNVDRSLSGFANAAGCAI